MFVCVDVCKAVLVINITSKERPHHNRFIVEICKKEGKVFEGVFSLRRIYCSSNLVKDQFIQGLEGTKEFNNFTPKYLLTLEIPCGLVGCSDYKVNIKDSKTHKLIESRSFTIGK